MVKNDMNNRNDKAAVNKELDSIWARARTFYIEQKYDRAFELFLELAERGDPYSQCFVGQMYASGTGVEKDLDESQAWLKKATDRGDAEAPYHIGRVLAVRGDISGAIGWYQMSADRGYSRAMCRLAANCELGLGVEKNSDKAFEYFEKAMAAGNITGYAQVIRFLLKGKTGIKGVLRGISLFPTLIARTVEVAREDKEIHLHFDI